MNLQIQRFVPVGLCAVLVVVLDQVTKWLAIQCIPQAGTVPVIAGFFDLVHIRNRGAAFGFLNRSDIDWQIWLFLGATLVAFGAIVSLVRTWPKNDPLLFSALGLVLGGAVGNMIDRIRFRAVVDFLDFYVGSWHWPAFNVADIAICCGAFAACIILWKTPQLSSEVRSK